MKAFIFAAGLGTRLYPITRNVPKALVRVNGIPLLEMVVKRLITFGIRDIVINLHHFPDQIIDFVKSKNSFGVNIKFSDESDQLLDTGGGLQKASWFFDSREPFLVHNVDVISNVDFNHFYSFHLSQGALATLAVRKRKSSRYLLFDSENILSGWRNEDSGETRIVRTNENLLPMAFSGIHFINPSLFDNVSESGKFSIIDLYLRLAKTELIAGYDHSNTFWLDVGRLSHLTEAEKIVAASENLLLF